MTAGLLAVAAGVLAVAVPAAPASAAEPVIGANLTLDPASGNADTNIMATFHVQLLGGGDGCRLKTTFTWDGHLLDRHNTNACTSHHNFQPPKGDRDPGMHRVMAMDDNTHAQAQAVFMITANGNVMPAPNNGNTGQANNDNQGNNQADNGTTATDPTTQAMDNNQPANPAPAKSVTPATAMKKTGFTGGYVIGAGAVLVLGGVAILIMLLMRGRRSHDPVDGYVDLPPDPDLVARFRAGSTGIAPQYPTQRMPDAQPVYPSYPAPGFRAPHPDEAELAYTRTTRLSKPPSLFDE